jgi:nucleoside-diphosphate-sugar epimerase
VVLHLAAQTSAYIAERDLVGDADTNICGFLRLLEALRSFDKAPLLVLAGSATELAPDSRGVTTESCRDLPRTFYDVGKSTQRTYLRRASEEGWVRGLALLLSNVYGGRPVTSPHRGFLNKCVARALEGEPLNYFRGMENLRDFIHIDDVVEAIRRIVEDFGDTNFDQFLIATSRSISIREAQLEIARQAEAVTGNPISVIGIDPPVDANQIEFRSDFIDNGKLTKLLGWSPDINLREGIGRLVSVLSE